MACNRVAGEACADCETTLPLLCPSPLAPQPSALVSWHPLLQAYPLDLVRTRLAAQTTQRHYTGIGQAMRMIVAEEGARGLYRGLGATLVQVGGWVGACAAEVRAVAMPAH